MAGTPTFGGATTDAQPGVLLVENDVQFRDFLRLGFEYEGCQVDTAASGDGALHSVALHAPDVLVIERELPDLSGIALIRRLRAYANDAVLILLEGHNSVDARIAGLEAGADDAMSKPIAFKELLARVAAGLRRRRSLNPREQLAFEDITLDQRTRLVQRHGRRVDLTPREFDLLTCFLRHPRQILSRDTIIDYVWGNEYRGDSNILDVYIHALREKLDDQPPRLLRTMRGMGYVLRGPDARTPRLQVPQCETRGKTPGEPPGETPAWAMAGLSAFRRQGRLPELDGSVQRARQSALTLAGA